MQRRYLLPLILGLLILAGGLAWEFDRAHAPRPLREHVPITHFTLKNGLTVVVMPNDRIPAVVHIMFVKSGAADDPYGKSGLAHYVEHMMFTGTKQYPEGTYDHAIQRAGGSQNAYTTRDFTAYYATVPKEMLPDVMAMESDRLQHLVLDPARAAREHKVITEERNMRVENSAAGLFGEQLDAITFLAHPYQRPTIGWPDDMAALAVDDVQHFYRQHYVPSNMVLVLAGDITVRTAERLAEHYYGGIPAAVAPPRDWPKEPPIRLSRHASMEDDKSYEPRLTRQYAAPSLVDGKKDQTMPLALLEQYLGGGSTSRLYQSLVVEQKLASDVSCNYDPFLVGPALFRINATPAPGVTPEALEAALDKALTTIFAAPPSIEDVTRAKTLLKADVVFAQDGLSPLAHFIGALYMLGHDEQYFYDWTNAVDAVTPQQVQQAAVDVLVPAHAVTGYLLPAHPLAAGEAPPPAAPPTEEDHVR